MNKASGTSVSIYTDGGARGNPGPAAYGFVIYDAAGEVIKEEGRYIGVATNNQAEYQAIVAALTYAKEQSIDEQLTCFLDSELVVRQINGVYRMKNEALRPHLMKIHALVAQFSHPVTFQHIPRSQNAHADRLVNMALDGIDHA